MPTLDEALAETYRPQGRPCPLPALTASLPPELADAFGAKLYDQSVVPAPRRAGGQAMIRGPITDRLPELEPLLPPVDPDWPEAIVGARCPDCGRFVGRLIVYRAWDGAIKFIAATCKRHGAIIACGWAAWP